MPGLRLIVSLALCCAAATGHAQIAGDKVKIGVLTDLSGAYEAASGAGSVEGARMAAEEFGWKVNGKPIEICPAIIRTSLTSAPRSPIAGSISKTSTPSPTW